MNKIKMLMFNKKYELKVNMKLFNAIHRKQKRENYEHKKFISRHDILTGLPNSVYFFEKLKRSLETSRINNKKGAIIYIDIDNYKTINSNWGYCSGDSILKLFSKLINECIRDEGEVARFNGDEFAILIHEFNYISEIEEICNKIYKMLRKPFKVAEDQVKISVSMGVSIFPDNSIDADELLKFCNFAIDRSKKIGKNTYTIFNNEIADKYYRKVLIKNELRNAINKDELSLIYQPQIDMYSNEIVGIEALLRWNNEKLGNVSPGEFIPIAEESGDIVQIGDWVIEKALEQANEWIKIGYKFRNIAVNISPVQIRKRDFKSKLLKCYKKYEIPPNFFEIEITENTLLDMSEEKIDILNELKNKGIKIAIDDFGTGYSSLSYLVNISVDTLKIDKAFVDGITNRKNKLLIKSIVNLSKDLEYKIVIEGVETKEQVNLLNDLGCNIIQGFYFCKPLPSTKMENLLCKL